MRWIGMGLAAMALAAMAACDTAPDADVDEAATEEVQPTIVQTPVERIQNLELGRLADGFMLTAFATAPGLGYYNPELRPRFGGRPGADGFLEYDFVVRPPEDPGRGTDAPIVARTVRADIPLSPGALRSALGVRVWSARDSVEGLF